MRSFFYFLPIFLLSALVTFADEDNSELPETQEPPANTANVALPTLFLRVGQRYPLEGVLASKAQIEPKSVASVHQTPEGLILVGHSPGNATLTLETEGKSVRLQVTVRNTPQEVGESDTKSGKKENSFLKELEKTPGIRFEKLGDKVFVQGEVLGRKAYQRLLFLLKSYSKKIILLAGTAPGVKPSLLEQAKALLKSNGLSHVDISNAGHRYFLEGTVDTPEQVDEAYAISQAVFPNIENHIPVPIRVDPTISVRISILELSRQAHQALGLSWPTSTQAGVALGPGFTAILKTGWSVQLNHLSAKGLARVLSEPIIAVKNGSSAELTAGGEIPIRVIGRLENKVFWKHYGLKIRIHIGGIAGRKIRTKIHTESSQLDHATAIEGIPGIKRTQMSTEVDAEEGKPVLLTGLFQAGQSKDIDKLPLLGDIPLFGELFKSRKFRENESELLVALLPSFGITQSKWPVETYRGLNFDFKWRIND